MHILYRGGMGYVPENLFRGVSLRPGGFGTVYGDQRAERQVLSSKAHSDDGGRVGGEGREERGATAARSCV